MARARTALLVVAVATVVAVVGMSAWEGRLRDEFESRVAALRASGEPVAMADLARPPIPAERNAAPLLIEAGRRFDPFDFYDPVAPDPLDWTAEEWTRIEAYVEAGRPYGDLLERALGRPECRFDGEGDVRRASESIFVAHGAMTYLRYRALVEGRRGNPDAAVRSLARLHGVAGLVRAETCIRALVRWGADGVAAETLEHVARAPGFQAAEARAILEPLLEAAEARGLYVEAWRGERAFAISNVRKWLDGEPPRLGPASPVPEWLLERGPLRVFAYRDGAACLDLMEEAIALEGLPWLQARRRAGEIRQGAEERAVLYLLTRAYPGVVDKMLRERARHAAALRLARVGLALLESEERWPERLPEGLPLDPFTDEPFRYERTTSGVRIEAAAPVEDEDDRIFWELRGEDGRR